MPYDVNKLIAEITRDEGFHTMPYRCPAGFLTIGVGRNLDVNGITQHEARVMLTTDLGTAERELLKILPNYLEYSDARARALLNMMFNLGARRFAGFVKMIDAVKCEDWEMAAHEAANSLWAIQVGDRASRIVKMLREG